MPTLKQTVIDLFEIEKLSPEKGAELIERLGKLIFQSVLVRVLPTLSEEDMAGYDKVVETGEPDQILKFLSEKVPDFENIVKEEAEALRVELSGEFQSAEV